MANLSILNDKNWHRWYAHMKVILGYQEVLEIVEKGYSPFVEDEPVCEQIEPLLCHI